jgi:uncharacterized protein YukJ
MPLPGYGLLIGKISASRPPRPTGSHWLLWVQPGNASHPPYRVAVNLKSTVKDRAPGLQYQIVNYSDRDALVRKLKKIGVTQNFLEAGPDSSIPRLDFVRGDVVKPNKFVDVLGSSNPLLDKFEGALAEVAAKNKNENALVAVFGTGYPIDRKTEGSVPTGFTGIENIHMNQGAMNLVNGAPYYIENGANQDGGLIFLLSTGARGFFVKFPSQAMDTDENGNPTVTGIDQIDNTSQSVRKAIMPPFRNKVVAAQRTNKTTVSTMGLARRGSSPAAGAPVPGKPNGSGYVFADVNPEDASGQYIPDPDGDTYKTPFVVAQSKGHTRGPVPTPRKYPRLDLASVVGTNPPGYSTNSGGKSIAFDVIGDSGAPNQDSLGRELKVTDLMAQDAQASPPAFLFHVGDVVYFYGEQDYFYSQFYEPFRAYPAPIFAIPGNHDGVTYNSSMISLDAFQKAFCASEPGRWLGSGGILRSAMTQPGVYFTLDAPLVSIIGLYSNCGESLGWLDEQQLVYLYQELVRLKKLRSGGLPAVILAIHHVPRWFPGQKDPNSTAVDATCKKAGFWPDAIISGHAHLYQRAVRQDTGKDIPYVITGAGGYAINPQQEVAKQYMATLTSSGGRLGRVILESGYVRATVSSPSRADPTLRFEYRSTKPMGNAPDDVCTVNLRTGKLV